MGCFLGLWGVGREIWLTCPAFETSRTPNLLALGRFSHWLKASTSFCYICLKDAHLTCLPLTVWHGWDVADGAALCKAQWQLMKQHWMLFWGQSQLRVLFCAAGRCFSTTLLCLHLQRYLDGFLRLLLFVCCVLPCFCFMEQTTKQNNANKYC